MQVSSVLLRQWYARYHPASGPFEIHSVEELGTAAGSDLRGVYAGMGPKAMHAALRRRVKAVVARLSALHRWQLLYASDQTV